MNKDAKKWRIKGQSSKASKQQSRSKDKAAKQQSSKEDQSSKDQSSKDQRRSKKINEQRTKNKGAGLTKGLLWGLAAFIYRLGMLVSFCPACGVLGGVPDRKEQNEQTNKTNKTERTKQKEQKTFFWGFYGAWLVGWLVGIVLPC